MDDMTAFVLELGKLVSNFQSLEFILRAFLYNRRIPPHTPFPFALDPYSLAVGNSLPLNAVTSYDALGKLIDKYNKSVESTHPELVVDSSLVELRDAIAHGRVSAADARPPLTLVKFSEPAGETVFVSYVAVMDRPWLVTQVTRVRGAIEHVSLAITAFQRGAA
jgi:hypothetical protein